MLHFSLWLKLIDSNYYINIYCSVFWIICIIRLTPKRLEKKIDGKKCKMIMEMKQKDNILWALDIQKKLIDKGVNVSTSIIRRALKMRKNTYKRLILLQWS